MKKNLLLILLAFLAKYSYEQTNVSGGIYSDVVWTKANSPYIIIDTVVVFPGITLTIEPGVTVKFNDGKFLEIRQGELNAEGTITDSITFTSNSSAPTPGIYYGVYMNGGNNNLSFNYCNFKYAYSGIRTKYSNTHYLTLKNSIFEMNTNGVTYAITVITLNVDSCIFKNNTNNGLNGSGNVNNSKFRNNYIGHSGYSIIQNCIIDSNQTGINRAKSIYNSLICCNQIGIQELDNLAVVDNCIIRNNQIGINAGGYNTVIKNCIVDSNSTYGIKIDYLAQMIYCSIKNNGSGILASDASIITRNIIEDNLKGITISNNGVEIFCNKICNNSDYDLSNNTISNINIVNNYWCTTDSISTAAVIFDGYDDVAYGIVTFMPMDTSCYLDSLTTIRDVYKNNSILIFPNPSSGKFTIETENISGKIMIANILGKIIHHSAITEQQTIIDLTPHPNGLYFYFLHTVDGNMQGGKFIIEY